MKIVVGSFILKMNSFGVKKIEILAYSQSEQDKGHVLFTSKLSICQI